MSFSLVSNGAPHPGHFTVFDKILHLRCLFSASLSFLISVCDCALTVTVGSVDRLSYEYHSADVFLRMYGLLV